MSVRHRVVSWNAFKLRYDVILWAIIILYVGLYTGATLSLFPFATMEIVLMRATGGAAFLLLHVILLIGPLCRISPRFLPLLYNRRHLGVSMCILALVHAIVATLFYHSFGNVSPLESILFTEGSEWDPALVPFQPFGFGALLIVLVMAATSHDFWLRVLSPAIWKGLHMLVYIAYALLIFHVAFGILQTEYDGFYVAIIGVGLAFVLGLHIIAARKEKHKDLEHVEPQEPDGFVFVCEFESISENRARIFTIGGERIAVFRYDGTVAALSNVCRHQFGPLGEGRIIDGCVTCPWHGYQYRALDGRSPAPFDEQVETYRTRVSRGRVFVYPYPEPMKDMSSVGGDAE